MYLSLSSIPKYYYYIILINWTFPALPSCYCKAVKSAGLFAQNFLHLNLTDEPTENHLDFSTIENFNVFQIIFLGFLQLVLIDI